MSGTVNGIAVRMAGGMIAIPNFMETRKMKSFVFAVLMGLMVVAVGCDEAKEAANDASTAVTDTADSVADGVTDTVEDIKNTDVEGAVKDVKEKGAEVLENAKEKGAEVLEGAKEKGAEALEGAKEKGKEVAGDLKDKAAEALNKATGE